MEVVVLVFRAQPSQQHDTLALCGSVKEHGIETCIRHIAMARRHATFK